MLKRVYADLLGHDTEFFLWDEKKGEVIPSYKYFGQKNEEPTCRPYAVQPSRKQVFIPELDPMKVIKKRYKLEQFTVTSGGQFRYYRDGLAVEFNSAPVTCRAWIWQDIKLAMATALSVKFPRLPKHIKFTARPWVAVSPEMIAEFPDDLKVLGCSPTFDAYTQSQKTITVNPLKLPFRTSGAHLHMSFEDPMPQANWSPLIKLSDLLIGLPFTHIFGDELEFKRRKLYGTAGEFRFQQYPGDKTGMEYRVLSSRLYNHPGIFSLFTGIWKMVVTECYANLWKKWDSSIEDDLQEAINVGTPALFPPLLKKATEMLNTCTSTYGLRLTGKAGKADGDVAMWDKLKELNAEGKFPDAGIINKSFPEAHKGWTEYSKTWGI